MKTKSRILIYDLIGILGCLALIAADQITKIAAIDKLKDKEPYVIIKGIFELHYLENRGAAFGILENQKIFFILTAIIILAGIGFLYNKMPLSAKYIPMRIVGILMASGAIGNMIDRIRNDYVIDFLYFKLIDFPIFNVADCYVTVAAALMIIFFLFVYKESDLEFISFKKKKSRSGE